jgi:parvulin-like peptidyl-prolyl isomerase
MYRIEAAVKEFEKTVSRPATSAEMRKVAGIVADQEVLLAYALDLELDREPVVEQRLARIAQFIESDMDYESVKIAADQARPTRSSSELASEARELGLQRQDLISRRVLIDNARRLIRAAALLREPTEQMLSDYLRAHPEQFRRPGETRITQLHFRSAVQGDALRSEAEALLRRLQSEGVRPEEAQGLVEASVLPRDLPLLSDREIARYFGNQFTQALSGLSEGSWQGPIASSYGLHLVYVHERTPARVPELSEIRARVVTRTRQKLADDWLALRLALLRKEYQVVMPWEDA